MSQCKCRIFYYIIFFCVFVFSCRSVLVSKQDVVYFFKPENIISSYEKRHYLNDSVFIKEKFSVTREPLQCCDTFKISSGKMFYQTNGFLFPYFSKEAFLSGDTVFIYFDTSLSNRNHCVIRYVPYEKKKINGWTTYGFADSSTMWSGDPSKYYVVYFLPSFGIVAYKEPRVDLSIIQIEKK